MPNFRNSLLKSLYTEKQGTVAIIVAVMLLLIVAILMMTVDLSRVQSGKANNQSATDASVLGLAEYITRFRCETGCSNKGVPTDIKEYARKIFDQNLLNDQSDANISVADFKVGVRKSITTVDGEVLTATIDEVIVYACVTHKTTFASVTGNGRSQKACSYSKATLPGFNNVEIVFALDNSGSMTDKVAGVEKLQALKDAVTTLINFYKQNTSIYWGVVPYSGIVDVGNNAPNIVEDDRASAANNNEVRSGSAIVDNTSKPRGTPEQYTSRFAQIENKYTSGPGAIFNDPDLNPGLTKASAIDVLLRFPLTDRVGSPAGSTTVFTDNSSPTNNKFQAYWHQPYKFFYKYDDTNQTCGTCVDKEFRTTAYEGDQNRCVRINDSSGNCVAKCSTNPPTNDPGGLGAK